MKTKVTYACGICEREFDSPEKASACEARGVDKPIVQVGDIVFLKAGYGWYDGDEAWVSNPETRMNMNGTGLSAHAVPAPKPCPKRESNCFSDCCTFKFYYVITAIDQDDRDPHRTRYHAETLAMTGKQGHRGPGYTYNQHHMTPELVKQPPPEVVKQSKALIGHKAKYLF